MRVFNHVYVPFIVGKSLSAEYVGCSLVNHFVTFYEGIMLHWICQAGFCLMNSLEVFPDLSEGMCLIMWVSIKSHNAPHFLKVGVSDTSSLSPHWELIFFSHSAIELLLCLGSLPCCMTWFQPTFSSRRDGLRFDSRMSTWSTAVTARCSDPVAAKQAQIKCQLTLLIVVWGWKKSYH